jgi:hypothetical protein
MHQSVMRSVPLVAAASLAIALGTANTLGAQDQAGAQDQVPTPQSTQGARLVLQAQGSFFIDGHTVRSNALTGTAGGGLFGSNEGDITVDQMYVQYMIPPRAGRHVPIVLLHGCCLSGKTYETTPDGRMGWDEYFVRKGHPVYVPDQVSRARSGFNATVFNEVKLGLRPPSDLPSITMASHKLSWELFRFGPHYGEVFPDEQFPVEHIAGLFRQEIPDLNALLPTDSNPTFRNLARLALRLHGAVVLGHSESGFFPQRATLVNPAGMRGLIQIEGGCDTTLTAGQFATLARVPILVVFGDHLGDVPAFAEFRLQGFRVCQRFIAKVNAAGGDATMLHLPESGLHGNSHMMMQDRNNLQVADLILRWIGQHVERHH